MYVNRNCQIDVYAQAPEAGAPVLHIAGDANDFIAILTTVPSLSSCLSVCLSVSVFVTALTSTFLM